MLERRLGALVDAMDDAVTVRDTAGRILLANPAAVALLVLSELVTNAIRHGGATGSRAAGA